MKNHRSIKTAEKYAIKYFSEIGYKNERVGYEKNKDGNYEFYRKSDPADVDVYICKIKEVI